MRNLPSLDLVRGFDAAARHLSFTRAAAELFLTQSAISRQIKTLEDQLGVALFQRRHRSLVLTDAGRQFQQAVGDALRLLHDAVGRIRGAGARRLTLSTTIGFASLWLIPRLHDFRTRHPDIDIRIDANNRLIDLALEEVDVAIRYCKPELAPVGAQRLFGERVIAVCGPQLLRDTALAKPADLARHVLLHYERADGVMPWSTWPVWLEAQGVGGLKPAASLTFSSFDHMIQAALDGQGIGLAPTPLVRKLLAEGRLVAPLAATTGSARAYYLLVEAGAAQRPHVRQFIEWIGLQAREEARAANDEFHAGRRARAPAAFQAPTKRPRAGKARAAPPTGQRRGRR